MKKIILKVLLFVTIPIWGPFYIVGFIIEDIWRDVSSFIDRRIK